MDLATLWNRERARVAAEVHDVSLSTGARNGAHTRGELSSGFPTSIAEATSTGRNGKMSVSAATTPVSSKKKPATSSPSGSSDSVVVTRDRERTFRALVDASVTPVAAESVPNFFGCNEFAMEYADRAVRRFFGAPQPPLQSQPPAPPVAINTANSGSSPSTSHGLTSRHSTSRVNSVASLQAEQPQAAPSPVPAASGFQPPAKSAQVLRKNGRKRAGTEFSTQAFRPYVGDMFSTRGEYIDGMLYMSRMKRSYKATFGAGGDHPAKKLGLEDAVSIPWGEFARPEGHGVLKDGVSDALTVAGGGGTESGEGGNQSTTAATSSGSGTSLSHAGKALDGGESDDEKGPDRKNVQRKQRQRCSLTLSNWSFNPENARLMVQENVVEALMRLCKDEDKITRLNCVTALMNLSHLGDLRRVIVQQGAVKTVAEIVNDSDDRTLRTACAITLCNLCCLDGEEELLVEDGAVSALSALINEHAKVSRICRSALFNLTCVSHPYHKMESVLKAFLALTNTRNGGSGGDAGSTEEYDDITAKALCNLSNFKRIRLRLMEEGIVSAITSLLHPNIPSIQELLAYVLLNLSRLPACRSEMVAKGCMGTLVALTGASDAIVTKCLIGSTLWNLSKDSGNAVRMVFENLLLLVNELCRQIGERGTAIPEFNDGTTTSSEEELLRACARTLYNVSCCEDAQAKLVERDAINTLSSLSRRSSGSDAKQMCTLALCNLLSVQKAAADIMTAGAITALIQLSMAPAQPYETRNLFSKALHGLCEKSSTRVAVTDAGVIPALLLLSSIDEGDALGPPGGGTDGAIQPPNPGVLSEIRARCTAGLACLAADIQTAAHVCNTAVVKCVTRILALERSNIAIERFCCSCLSLLCRDEQCSLIMVEVGAIEMVLATCVESHDLESKGSCCHVLASMSCHPSCCMALVRMGAISVLATLAKVKDDAGIQRCCAITLANLSVEPAIREILASAGTVTILAVLSDSYSEENQRDCAKVLCNLSCIRGNEAALVAEGAVAVLMMISLVRAVSTTTKETCLRALLNLLNAETMKRMVQEGLVKVLPAFATLESNQVSKLVTILFSKLLNHPVGRNALCAERQALQALFRLMEVATEVPGELESGGDQLSVATLHENLLSELVYYDNSRLLSVQTGIFGALHRITMVGNIDSTSATNRARNHCAERKLALIFFTLAKSEESRMAVSSPASLATLMKFLKLHAPREDCRTSECALFAVATLCRLAWHEDTRTQLQIAEVPSSLAHMLHRNATTPSKTDASSTEDSSLTTSLQAYPVQAIKTCVLTLCCLAHSSGLLEVMLRENIMTHLNNILAQSGNNGDSDGAGQGSESKDSTRSPVAADADFVALVCILFRQLSHIPLFSSSVAQQPAPILQLFCTLSKQVVGTKDVQSCLDCADALCSIVFASSQQQDTGVGGTRASSIEQGAGVPMPPKPSRVLVDDSVLGAIGDLLSDDQLPETRWRCAASLWALSGVPEHRQKLVELGVTRMLVSESYRAAESACLNTLQCCAGALCNLTIVPEEASAARMVDEGAMPALIQLAKMENDTIREHCTLALSNLSGPSPKVESGAVSALLNLSLGFATSSSPSTPSLSAGEANGCLTPTRTGINGQQQRHAVVCRPPLVCGERHKQFAVPPEFDMEITTDSALHERKFEADLLASTPPPPHLPTITADLDGSNRLGTSSGEHADNKAGTARGLSHHVEDDSAGAPKKSEVASGDAVSEREEAARESAQARFFSKLDPEESLSLMAEAESDTTAEDEFHQDEAVGNQEVDSSYVTVAGVSTATQMPSRGGEGGISPSRSTEKADTLNRLHQGGSSRKPGSSLGAGSSTAPNCRLSPLSRVVVRKAHTVQAARKFKETSAMKARARASNNGKHGMIASRSSPCLTKRSTNDGFGGAGMDNMKRGPSGRLGVGTSSKPPAQLSSLSPSMSTSLLPVQLGADDEDPRVALAAAVAAAGLYGAVPMRVSDLSYSTEFSNDGINGDRDVTIHQKAQKSSESSKKSHKKLLALSPYAKPLIASRTEPELADELTASMSRTLTPATTIAEFQVQAKKLGLWS